MDWEINIDHTDLKFDDLLDKLLPSEIPKDFPITTIKNIKIIELSEKQQKYKQIIAKALIETAKDEAIDSIIMRNIKESQQ